jgi:hypothetical protein
MAFAASGIFFIVSGIRSGDPWTVAGSAVWMVGVAFFLLGLRDSG